ncbi:hypothetical protein HWV62_21548 [Athelia sp. TMB]|nr:hypothetical protein HWV62_21548 [Athelia sp. TMB]
MAGIAAFVAEHTGGEGGEGDMTIWSYSTTNLSLPLPAVLAALTLQSPPPSSASTPSSSPDTIREPPPTPSATELLSRIRTQSAALPPAFAALSRALLQLTSTWALLAPPAHASLSHQRTLLNTLPADLDRLVKVAIGPEFVNGRRGRTLGDYVSGAKMGAVGEACAKAWSEFGEAVEGIEGHLGELEAAVDVVREEVADHSILNEAASSPTPSTASLISLYNAHTTHVIPLLRRIAVLNAALLPLPAQMARIQELTAQKDAAGGKWAHVARLHGMAPAYGATLAEALRRRVFAMFFWARVGVVAEVFAGVSSAERRRRHAFRSETRGTLPFATPKLDGVDDVPSVDFVRTGGNVEENGYAVERADVEEFIRTLATTGAEAEAAALRQRLAKMDALEAGFERVVARAHADAEGLMRELDDARAGRDDAVRALEDARAREEVHAREIERLRRLMVEDEEALEEARAQTMARELEVERLHDEARVQGLELDAARSVAEQRARELERTHGELHDTRTQLAEARAAEQHSLDIDTLREAHAADLEEIRANHATDLDSLRSMHAQAFDALRASHAQALGSARAELDGQRREKDRRAAEADRALRDHIAEADGDRAVLEHQCAGLRSTLEDVQGELRDARGDAAGLREELARVERELRDARHVERVLREDVRAGREGEEAFETRLEESRRLVAQLLDVALAFRAAHARALATAQSLAPSAAKAKSLGDSVFAPGARAALGANALPTPLIDEPEPLDPADPAGALEVLRAVDHDHFLDEIRRTIRKWQKQCKEYRERAKGKISFRNFGEGDLALFLPTRNSVAKPWAAFNVSFPHYFLQATGHLGEQLKTREWIVARITSIAERVVDHNDPTSNPYGLGDGVKYYMLQVEDWTQPSQNQKRRPSASNINSASNVNTNSKRKNSHSIADLAPLSSSPLVSASPPNPNPEGTSLSLTPPAIRTQRQILAEPPQILQTTDALDDALDHFDTVRARARTRSPPPAGPSSLSHLLAQAPSTNAEAELSPTHIASPFIQDPQEPDQDHQDQPLVQTASPLPIENPLPETQPLPITASPPPPSPSTGASSLPRAAGHAPSPLRPGSRASRASRMSTTSFPAAVGKAKAAPTIALSGTAGNIPDASPPRNTPPSPVQSISPGEEPSDGLANMASVASMSTASTQHRRRTASHHTPSPLASGVSGATASGTLASLASSWGVSFGRKKAQRGDSMDAGATDILKRF